MLEAYKKDFLGNSIQFVLLDKEGLILDSDDTCMPLAKGDSIIDFHPFFESLDAIVESDKEEHTFNCVHLQTRKDTLICDLVLKRVPEGFLLIMYDLTQHYEEYQTVAQARNESIIQEQLIALKNIELEERERFKNQFIRNFSHEIRNPLTSIMSLTQVLSQTDLDAEQERMVKYLVESNANLKLLLEDILSLSMIAAGKLSLNEKEFELDGLLELLHFTYTAKAKETGLSYHSQIDDRIPKKVIGDRLRLYQVLTNLLDNALKYTPRGEIRLSVMLNQVRANRANIRFSIKDSGRGIPADQLSSIFDSFTQSRESDQEMGMGLGLSIVKGLLELMDTEIQVSSELEKGSEFYFDINLKVPLPSASDPSVAKSGIPTKYAKRGFRKEKYRILLVEDDAMIQTILFKFLANTDKFYIELISDGARVMEEVINTPYDLIVMDINIPNISGDQIARLIRDFPFKGIKDIPIIGVTGSLFEDDLERFKKAGINTVLAKPFNQEELLNKVFKFIK